uniref:F5/8 type C domain-containing protein n=1 Tax=viral metagenome TaxID=1070528 RepID=A0A6C0D2L1_9ZZZZ
MKILQNVYILYVVFLISLLNIGWFVYYNNYNNLIAFITCCLTVYLMNHNMIVVLGVSMVVVNTLSLFNLVKIFNTGFKEGATSQGVRYISIENSTQNPPTYIQIGGLKAFDNTGVNVASKKSTYSSGNWPGLVSSNAVDDDPYTFFHTSDPPKSNQYWYVDLGKEYNLSKIEYNNRINCCQNRIIGCIMRLYNNAGLLVRDYRFTSDQMTQTFVVEDAAAKAQQEALEKAKAESEAEKKILATISATKDPAQTSLIQPFTNRGDDDSDDENDDEKSNYMKDKTIINKLKKFDPIVMDILMNMKNGHIDTINQALNHIIDGNVVDH